MRKDTLQWLIPVLLALCAALALWIYWVASERSERPVATTPAQGVTPPEPDAKPGPIHPLREPEDMETERLALRPLPSLDQSDEYFKLALTDLFGSLLGRSLGESRLIERLAASVDNLPRQHVAERMRPVTGVEGQFLVDEQEGSGEYRLDPGNYQRYNGLVSMISGTEAADVADVYRRFYPLLQKAYVNLGYPDGYFNDRVVEVIDNLLATPDIAEPPLLVRPHVLYEYADPELEKLSSGQKILIRIGPGHRATIKEKLRELRALIA